MRLHSEFSTCLLLLALGLLPAAAFAGDAGNFYKADKSLRDAMGFIGVATETQASFEKSIVGTFPTGAGKKMAERLVQVRAEKNLPLFLELVGKPSVEALKAHVGNDGMVDRIVGSVRDGTYLGMKAGARYFATFKSLSEEERKRYASYTAMQFDPLPNATIAFYYFDPVQKRLIGTRFEVHASGNTVRLLLPAFKKGR